MARNAHPEVTQRRILDTAKRLFIEQGYANTSIQNIVDELGDLSKGAIYHHFKSKEDIFKRLNEEDGTRYFNNLSQAQNTQGLNGLEKLQTLFRLSFSDNEHISLTRQGMHFLDDPKEFTANFELWSHEVPKLWTPLIQEGIEDGSIPTQYPKEAAELLSILTNYWLVTYFFPATKKELEHRIRCLATMLNAINVPVFDDHFITEILDSGALIMDKA